MVIYYHNYGKIFMISLKSQITQKILNYYFLNPHARHYINELAQILEMDPKNTDRKLKELEQEKILKSEFFGNQRYFSLNKGSPMAKVYKNLVSRTIGLEQQLKSALGKVKGLKQAYIYGSYAKNKMDSGSDIDILAIGSHSVLQLQKAVNPIQKFCGRAINVTNLTEQELKEKKKKGNSFIANIFSSKTIKLK